MDAFTTILSYFATAEEKPCSDVPVESEGGGTGNGNGGGCIVA